MPLPMPLSIEFPELRFEGKFADVVALDRGDAALLRPDLEPEMRARWSRDGSGAPSTALVLGGNGFVGAHLVAQLSTRPGMDRVWTTIRGSGGDPAARLRQTLEQYEVTAVDWDRITVLDGTPTAPRFGLTRREHDRLQDEVDLVFSCASSTDYSVGYLDLRHDWFLSLLRTVQFCATGRPKHLSYVGSIGRFFYQQPADFQRGDSWWYSGYAQMKWVNAQLLLALGEQGFPVTLCDTHYVLGSTTVGLDPGRSYSWWRAVEVARNVGVIWSGEGMNYVPVDVLVDVLARNATSASPLPRMLPRNVDPYRMDLLADLLKLEVVPWERFEQAAYARNARLARVLLSERFDRLLTTINAPEPLFPAGVDLAWSDNRERFEAYLGRLQFRPVKRPAPARAVTDLTAVERAVHVS
jgi:nucleoside-diphosphate-sugar epimerase